MNKHNPPKSSRKKVSRLDVIGNSIIQYMELSKAALVYLEHKKRLPMNLKAKMSIEINISSNFLTHFFKYAAEHIQKTAGMLRVNSKEWEKNVKRFADEIAPEKSSLITVEQFQRERRQKRRL